MPADIKKVETEEEKNRAKLALQEQLEADALEKQLATLNEEHRVEVAELMKLTEDSVLGVPYIVIHPPKVEKTKAQLAAEVIEKKKEIARVRDLKLAHKKAKK